MKYLNFFYSLLLVASLSACSDSGSSDEPDSSTSTNTVPPVSSTVDGGSSSEPTNDQPTSAGVDGDTSGDDDGDTDTSVNTDSDTDGGEDSEDGNDSNTDGTDSDGSSDTGDDSDNTGESNTDDDTDSNSENDNTDSDSGDTGEIHTDVSNPVIDPDSALGQLQSRIKTLTGRTLIALNQSLSQGEMLSAQQEQCLGTYDPAIGEPLLSIDCEQPLATGEVPIFASIASLQDTPECRASLQNANADACAIDQAQMSINPIFTTPETGRPQLKQAGAMLGYNIEQDRLTLQSLTPPLAGTFFCEYDLSNGNAIGGDPGGNCYNQLNRICDLIDEQLAIEN